MHLQDGAPGGMLSGAMHVKEALRFEHAYSTSEVFQ